MKLLGYIQQRKQLSDYHGKGKVVDYIMEYEIEAAKELGNFDKYLNKIVTRNDAELNIFYDYISLYRRINGKSTMVNWRLDNPNLINEKNKGVITAFEKAKFAVLRLDKHLSHGAIICTDVVTKMEYILMDRALNESKLEGSFFVCTVLNMGSYIMTSGSGTPLDPSSALGKSILTLLKKHLDKLRIAKRTLNRSVISCVREIFGFCLRSGALKYMTVK